MGRKTKHSMSGRPPKPWWLKFLFAARAMVTTPVAGLLVKAQEMHGIPSPNDGRIASDIVRLYIYRGLEHDGLLDTNQLVDENGEPYADDTSPESWNPREDPSWDSLKEKGLV